MAALSVLLVSSIVIAALYLRTRSALASESEQHRIADRQVQVAQAINAFLTEDLLAAADPRRLGRDVSVAEALDIASEKVGSRFAEQPEVEAPLRVTLGVTYSALGKLDASLRELRIAAPLAERIYGPNHVETVRAYTELANVHRRRGEVAQAEKYFQKAIRLSTEALGKLDRRTLQIENNLALLYRDAARFDEAETLSKRALEDRRRALGPSDPDVMASLNNLAYLYQSTGRFDEAVPMATQALELIKTIRGEDHPDTLIIMSNLAWLLMGQQKFAEAEGYHRRALEAKERILGPDHAETVSGMHGLAECFRLQGRYAEAADIFKDAEAAAHRAWPEDGWMISSVQGMYGEVLLERKRYDEAERTMLERFERLERTVGAGHELSQMILESLIRLYEETERPERAAVWKEKKAPTPE